MTFRRERDVSDEEFEAMVNELYGKEVWIDSPPISGRGRRKGPVRPSNPLVREPDLRALMEVVCRASLMDTTELALCSDVAVSTTDHRLKRLEAMGLVGRVPHAYGPLARTTRLYPTRLGIREIAHALQMTPLQFARQHRITDIALRSVMRRIDGLAVIYRLARRISEGFTEFVPLSIEIFQSGPFDVLLRLRGGGSIGVMRQGRARLRSGFGRRLGELVGQPEAEKPSVMLIITDTWSDLDFTLGSSWLKGEGSIFAGTESIVVGSPSDIELYDMEANLTSLSGVIQCLATRTSMAPAGPSPENRGKVAVSEVISEYQPQFAATSSGKMLLNTLLDWVPVREDLFPSYVGVTPKRIRQIAAPLLDLGLITELRGGDFTYYGLTDEGIEYAAYRDRASPGSASQRWSVVGPRPERWYAGHMRKMWRERSHTDALFWFVGRLVEETRGTLGYSRLRIDPAHRSIQRGVLGNREVAIEPDASGWIYYEDDHIEKDIAFVVEWERRGVTVSRAATKVELYQRFWASGGQWTDGTPPLALFLFDGPAQEGQFLKAVELAEEDGNGVDVLVPFATSYRTCLEDRGVLGRSWRLPYDGADADRSLLWEINHVPEADEG